MTWHIHIQGQVQGVGFRPFVYVLAQQFGLNGWVNNTVDGVHIVFNAVPSIAENFKQAIIKQAPRLARITSIALVDIEEKFFDNFQIIHSEDKGQRNLLLTPDFGMCEDCKRELQEQKNRRKEYAFITCTNCGPRYSIIHSFPYDRVNTEMDSFKMCDACQAEYNNPLDRRYYSQTNSCPDCAIELQLFNHQQAAVSISQSKIIDLVVQYWKAGKIVAIKGIGGYLLTCDATNEKAIQTLRARKYRPSKPFALMYPSLDDLVDFQVEDCEREMLESAISPIILLKLKPSVQALKGIAPSLNRVGVMLPYTPLYDLLLQNFGKPIIATSGNVSGSPIVFKDKKALNELTTIADFILTNNREIVVPQDDSVIQFTTFKKQPIILRRSRGLAPTYINANLTWSKESTLAMGAMLKSTFSLLHNGNVYISQYLGDLEHFDTQQHYEQVMQHFLQLFDTQPEFILCDKHSAYPSAQFGKKLAEEFNISFSTIQHHIAHFGAVLGENNLLHSEAPVLGVIWDGTGLGEDGQIWGGEFFNYQNYDFTRCTHFGYFDFILGDKMPKEPRISALSACWGVTAANEILKEKFSKIEWQVYSKLLEKENTLKTSSVGRLFDAVASLLGILDQQTYEGEAAMQLEAMATRYFKAHGLHFSSSYFEEVSPDNSISTKALMLGIIRDLQQDKTVDWIAAKFHYSLVQLIKYLANNLNIHKIAFSGGVFQNGLLVDLIQHHLSQTFDLYFHQQLSPNDENISFGQLVCHEIHQFKSLPQRHIGNSHSAQEVIQPT